MDIDSCGHSQQTLSFSNGKESSVLSSVTNSFMPMQAQEMKGAEVFGHQDMNMISSS
jgi:hypothetical protein